MNSLEKAGMAWCFIALVIILWFNHSFGGDGMLWPLHIQAYSVLAVAGPVLGFLWIRAVTSELDRQDELAELRIGQQRVQIPTPPSSAKSGAWVLGGAVIPVAIGALWIANRPDAAREGAGFFTTSLLLIGVFLARYSSPRARYHRQLDLLLHAAKRHVQNLRQAQEDTEREQRETKWLARLKDATYWWVAHGSRLTSDVQYFEDYLRAHATQLLNKKQEILRAYNDDSDPCASQAGILQIATWAMEKHQELLVDRLPNPTDRTVDRLVQMLHAYRKRDVTLLTEAEPANVGREARAVPPIRDESMESRWRRTVRAAARIMDFKSQSAHEIIEAANATEDPVARKEFIDLHTQLLNDLVRDELRRRMEDAP